MFRAGMMSRIALASLCLLTLAGASKCVFISTDDNDDDDDGGGQVIEHDDFVTTLVLRDSAGTPATSFVMGESIRFDLEVRNTSGHLITLSLPTTQVYDFYVLEPVLTNIRWRWSEGMSFPQVVTPLDFPVNSSKSYSVTWSGVLSDGTQLPVGSYRARGVIVVNNFLSDPLVSSPLGSNIVNFTVR